MSDEMPANQSASTTGDPHTNANPPENDAASGNNMLVSNVSGDKYEIGEIRDTQAVAIGAGARAEINQYTEIIVKIDSLEDLPPASGNPPFKGLTYFTENDADNFFGRESLTSKVTRRLRDSRFLVIVGASGSGKSSLLRAGVVPVMRRQNWLIHVITPSANPLEQLAHTLTRDESDLTAVRTMHEALAHDPDTLRLAANQLVSRENGSRLLLLVDQFEELFTLCKDEFERQAFLDNLQNATNSNSVTTVLLGLRADFYDRCLQYEVLRAVLAGHQVPIGPMKQDELVRVIAEPAKQNNWQFVEGLVEQILEDVGHEPGRLPLLSHALLETWVRRRGTVMTLSGYRDAGGVEGAIAQTAEETLEQLTPSQVAIMEYVFLALTELGEGAEDTRRIATRKEMIGVHDDGAVVGRVIEKLVDARLVIVDGDNVEVAHEALIRRWPRLREWLEDNRERLRFERQLTRDAKLWRKFDHDPDVLYRGARLLRATEWQEEEAYRLGVEETTFLAASRDEAEREERQKEQQRQRELEQERALVAEQARAAKRLRYGLGILLLFLVAAVIASIFAVRAQNLAQDSQATAVFDAASRATAEANAITREAEALSAAKIEAQARATAEVSEARAFELANIASTAEAHAIAAAEIEAQARATAEASEAAAKELAIAAQSRALASDSQAIGHENNMLALLLAIEAGRRSNSAPAYNALSQLVSLMPRPTLTITNSWGLRNVMVWEKVGNRLAIPNGDTLEIWDLDSREPLVTLDTDNEIFTVKWSGDGNQILIGSGGDAQVWDVTSGNMQAVLQDASIWEAMWSKNGSQILEHSFSGPLQLWDVHNGNLLYSLPAEGSVEEMRWSEDEVRILTLSKDGSNGMVKVWDAANGDLLHSLSYDNGLGIMWLENENQFFVYYRDGTINVWDLASESLMKSLTLQSDIKAARWNGELSRILTINRDHAVNVWDAEDGTLLLTLPHSESVHEAKWNRDEGLILTISDESYLSGGQVQVWDAALGELLLTLPHGDEVFAANLNDDENQILSYGADGSAKVWDAKSGQLLRVLTHDDVVMAAQWIAEESRILTISGDQFSSFSRSEKTVNVWDTDGEILWHTLRHDSPISWAKWNEDESQILTYGEDGLAKVWETSGGTLKYSLHHDAPITRAIWNEDESQILTYSDDGIAKVWETAVGALIYTLLHDDGIVSAQWNEDESLILTSSKDHTAKVWDAGSGELMNSLNHEDSLWSAKWNKDESLIMTTSVDGSARVWDADSGELINVLNHDAQVWSAKWNKDESLIMTNIDNSTVSMWDADKGSLLYTLTHDGRIGEARWNEDENQILTRSDDGTAKVWDAKNGKLLFVLNHDDWVWSAKWNKDESLILTSSTDDTAKVWDATSGALLHTLAHNGNVGEPLWNEDESQILSRSQDGTVKVWDARNGLLLQTLSHNEDVSWMELSGDGSRIMTSSKDGTVRIWDLESGDELLALPLDGTAVTSAQWNKDESQILMVSEGGLARVYLYPEMDNLLEEACQVATRNLTWPEWQRFVPGEKYRRTCPSLPSHELAESLIAEGERLAGDGKIKEAIVKFEEAHTLDLSLDFDPQVEAERLAAPFWVEEAVRLVREGSIQESLAAINLAQTFDPYLEIPALQWNQLCWFGTLWGHAAKVFDTCERAVASAAEDEEIFFQDSRGLARALTGDYEGAIQDFTAFVEGSRGTELYDSYGSKRESWIEALKDNINPFDTATLEELMNE